MKSAKTPCPHCYTAINETDTTCYSCGEAIPKKPNRPNGIRNLRNGLPIDHNAYMPQQAAHGCCECDESTPYSASCTKTKEKDQTLKKIAWAVVFAVIGGLITAFAKGEL